MKEGKSGWTEPPSPGDVDAVESAPPPKNIRGRLIFGPPRGFTHHNAARADDFIPVARKEVEPAAPGTLEERTLRLEKLMRASLEIQARLIKTSIASLGLSLILLTMFLSR